MADRKRSATDATKATNASHLSPASHSSPQEGFIPRHGGYENLLSYQKSQIIYDATVRFCARALDKKSRTCDQMVQAARSGSKNISEGSQVSGTSKESELKLVNVARASLEELLGDYQEFIELARQIREADSHFLLSRPARLAMIGKCFPRFGRSISSAFAARPWLRPPRRC